MQVKKAIKRIVALGTGAAMVGATVMGAMAADLSNYPNQYLKTDNGRTTFDGYVVVGKDSKSIDTLGAIAISNKLQTKTVVYGDDSSSSVSVSGDSWQVKTSSNYLELNENISQVETYIDGNQLKALADGKITNEKGTADYEQYLYFDLADTKVVYEEDTDIEKIAEYFKVADDSKFARYVLDFKTDLESDIITSGSLDDLEDKQISMMGKSYNIVRAMNGSNIELTLMSGSIRETMNEGDSKTYTIDGKDYEVTLQSVATYGSTEKVKFKVNGELTSALADGDTYKTADGTEIGISDITYQNYAGGIHAAEFYLGADKVYLKDNNELEVNGETINGADVMIDSTESGGDIAIHSIAINMTAQDNYWVPAGKKLSENANLNEPGLLFTQNWDISFEGPKDVSKEDLKIGVSSDKKYYLEFTNGDDESIKLPLVYEYNTSNHQLLLGDRDGYGFVMDKSTNITKNDYFILNTKSPTSSATDAKTYVLQYKGADRNSSDSPKATFDVLGGSEVTGSITKSTGAFDIKLGGETYSFTAAATGLQSDNDYDIKLTGSSNNFASNSGTVWENYIRTKNNALVTLEYDTNVTSGQNYMTVNVTTDDGNRMDTPNDESVVFKISEVSGLEEADLDVVSSGFINDPQDDNIDLYMTNYGSKFVMHNVDSSSDYAEISIPESQTEYQVYVTSGKVKTTTSTSGSTIKEVIPIDAAVFDSAIAGQEKSNNLIIVGGPCVNKAVAGAGFSEKCDGWALKEGEAMIKMIDNGDKVAMLVAGTTGADTQRASKVLANYGDYTMSGAEVIVKGTSAGAITVEAPTVAKE